MQHFDQIIMCSSDSDVFIRLNWLNDVLFNLKWVWHCILHQYLPPVFHTCAWHFYLFFMAGHHLVTSHMLVKYTFIMKSELLVMFGNSTVGLFKDERLLLLLSLVVTNRMQITLVYYSECCHKIRAWFLYNDDKWNK